MIIRIHNTGDPYKLPTLSVHTTASFPFFLFLALSCSFSLSLLAHSFFSFLPFSSLFFLPCSRPCPTCRGNLRQVHRSLWPPSFHLFLLNERRQAACLSRSLFYRAEHRHWGTYPTVRCSRTMALFLHLIPDLTRLTLSSLLFSLRLSSPPLYTPCFLSAAFLASSGLLSRRERANNGIREKGCSLEARKRVTPEVREKERVV